MVEDESYLRALQGLRLETDGRALTVDELAEELDQQAGLLLAHSLELLGDATDLARRTGNRVKRNGGVEREG